MSEEDQPAPDETPPAESDPAVEDEHEFLLPGPTPESNEGCFAWGLSWVILSLVLILIVAIMSIGCYAISRATGIL